MAVWRNMLIWNLLQCQHWWHELKILIVEYSGNFLFKKKFCSIRLTTNSSWQIEFFRRRLQLVHCHPKLKSTIKSNKTKTITPCVLKTTIYLIFRLLPSWYRLSIWRYIPWSNGLKTNGVGTHVDRQYNSRYSLSYYYNNNTIDPLWKMTNISDVLTNREKLRFLNDHTVHASVCFMLARSQGGLTRKCSTIAIQLVQCDQICFVLFNYVSSADFFCEYNIMEWYSNTQDNDCGFFFFLMGAETD